MKILLTFLFFSISGFGYEFLSYANAIIDYIVFVDEEFLDNLPGERGGSSMVDWDSFQTYTQKYDQKSPGGSGVNTLKGLAILGHDCAVIGRSGNDPDGLEYIALLEEKGISIHFRLYDTPTGRVVCFISPDGRRTMRAHLGKVGHFSPFEIEEELFEHLKIFHIEGYAIRNPAFLKEIIAIAKEKGALISMDVGCKELVQQYHEELSSLIDESLDILFTNGDEGYALTKETPEIACQILSTRCPIAVVTNGEKGGFVGREGRVFAYEATPTQLVDDTGAGDYFMAGFLHGILDEKSPEECAQMGSEMASQIIGVLGCELPLAHAHVRNDH